MQPFQKQIFPISWMLLRWDIFQGGNSEFYPVLIPIRDGGTRAIKLIKLGYVLWNWLSSYISTKTYSEKCQTMTKKMIMKMTIKRRDKSNIVDEIGSCAVNLIELSSPKYLLIYPLELVQHKGKDNGWVMSCDFHSVQLIDSAAFISFDLSIATHSKILQNCQQYLADFPAVFFHIPNWYLSWNTNWQILITTVSWVGHSTKQYPILVKIVCQPNW